MKRECVPYRERKEHAFFSSLEYPLSRYACPDIYSPDFDSNSISFRAQKTIEVRIRKQVIRFRRLREFPEFEHKLAECSNLVRSGHERLRSEDRRWTHHRSRTLATKYRRGTVACKSHLSIVSVKRSGSSCVKECRCEKCASRLCAEKESEEDNVKSGTQFPLPISPFLTIFSMHEFHLL